MTQYVPVSTILLLYTIMFISSTCIYFDFIYERCITVLISYMAVNNRVFAVGLFYFCILNVAMQGFKFECITFVAKLIIGMPCNIF